MPMKDAIKRIAEAVARRRRSLNRRNALILMYHGLTEDPRPDEWTQVSCEEFERQARLLSRHYRVVHLRDLVEALAAGKPESRLAAITFDDGYRSVATLAAPILERLGLPATLFLTSEFPTTDPTEIRLMWPDRLRLRLASLDGPRVDLSGFDLGSHDLSSPKQRRRSAHALSAALKTVPSRTKDAVLAHLDALPAKGPVPAVPVEVLPMTWAQAGALAKSRLWRIGGHTRTHPILSRHDRDLLEVEIVGGKADLEARLGLRIEEFAYPNGRRQDYDDDAVAIVRRTFRCATTTVHGLNAAGADPMLLKRIGIGNRDSGSRFLDLARGLYGA